MSNVLLDSVIAFRSCDAPPSECVNSFVARGSQQGEDVKDRNWLAWLCLSITVVVASISPAAARGQSRIDIDLPKADAPFDRTLNFPVGADYGVNPRRLQ